MIKNALKDIQKYVSKRLLEYRNLREAIDHLAANVEESEKCARSASVVLE